jgi:hypothetical protein
MTDETETEQTEFSYKELSARAQEKARDWFCSSTLDYEWWGHMYSYATEQGKERGFDIEDIRFSGFCSQGDGASWTGRVDLKQFLEYHLKEDNPEYARYFVLQAIIDEGRNWVEHYTNINRHGYHYVHDNMMRLESIDWGGLDNLEVGDEERLQADGPLQRADIYQLREGINIGELMDTFETWVLEEAQAYARQIYDDLESEHDHLTSEESLIESAEANGWMFDEDGVLI